MEHVKSSAYTVKPFAGIARVPFLLLSVAVVATGATAAAYSGAFDAHRTFLALIGLMLLHVAVNALNEASDYTSGIDLRTDPTPFSGGSKTIPNGALSPDHAYLFGYAAAAAGALIGLYFLVLVGPILLPFLVIGAICVLAYTDVLAKYGVGELAAGLGLGALPVAGTALVQNGTLARPGIIVAIPAFFLTFNLLLLNEFPDQAADRYGGRRNLIHILGRKRAAALYVTAALAVPASLFIAVILGALPTLALLGILPTAILARPISWALTRPHAPLIVDDLRDNVIWVLATNFLLALGLYLATPANRAIPVTGIELYDSAFLAGRALFGGVIAVMAINNLVDLDTISDRIGAKGVAYPRLAVTATTIPLLLAAATILTGICPAIGASYIIVFMVGATFVVHNFWSIDDPEDQDNEAFHFFKNLLIIAAALLLLASTAAPWPYALTGPC